MKTITLHPSTTQKLASLRRSLPHGLLLAGKPGTGLYTVARDLAGSELLSIIEPIDAKGNSNHDTGTISVAMIRALYEQTRTKSTKRRIVIIDDAERMSSGAQAAFLKLLEEPGENIYFILTSHAAKRLLPTIRSRLQTVNVEPILASQTEHFLDALGINDQKTRVQLSYLAAGLPAELTRLVADQAYFKQRAEAMADTRTFLTGSVYERLLIIHAYHQDRSKALQLIDSCLVVTERSLRAKPQPNLVSQLEALLAVRDKIEANGNIRLQLMAFVV